MPTTLERVAKKWGIKLAKDTKIWDNREGKDEC